MINVNINLCSNWLCFLKLLERLEFVCLHNCMERERWGGRFYVSVLFAIVFLFLLMVKFRISIQAHLNKSLNETPQESLHVLKNLIHSFFHSLSLSLSHTHTHTPTHLLVSPVFQSAECCPPLKERRSLHHGGRDLHRKMRRRRLLRMEGWGREGQAVIKQISMTNEHSHSLSTPFSKPTNHHLTHTYTSILPSAITS